MDNNTPPVRSIFSAFSPATISEEQKSSSSHKSSPYEDPFAFSPELAAGWKDLVSVMTKGRSSRENLFRELQKPLPEATFDHVAKFFAATNSNLVPEFKGYIPEEVMLAAASGIQHAYHAIIKEIAWGHSNIDKYVAGIHGFHRFFWKTAGKKGCAVLPEKVLGVLQESVKITINTWQGKLVSVLDVNKMKGIGLVFLNVIQTVGIIAGFGEPEGLAEGKYKNVIEYLKIMFALISQSEVFERIFTEPVEFAKGTTEWHEVGIKRKLVFPGGRYTILSINRMRFSEEKETPVVTLKYMLMYYHYKILKLLVNRKQTSYDEHILSIFSKVVRKNKASLSAAEPGGEKCDRPKVELALNENLVTIKAYIVNVAYFSDNLDTMQRLEKYTLVRETAIATLLWAVKAGMCFSLSTPLPEKLSITDPADFVSLVFNALLLYKKVRSWNPSAKFAKELVQHVNILCSELMPKTLSSDFVSLYTYRLYFVQFVAEWDTGDLKEKFAKYVEEVSRYLADSDGEDHDTAGLRKLKENVRDHAVGLYVKLSRIEQGLPIETVVGFVKEHYTDPAKLYKFYYTSLSVLCGKRILAKDFGELLAKTTGDFKDTVWLKAAMNVNTESGAKKFIQKEGMSALYTIYKSTLNSYSQTYGVYQAEQTSISSQASTELTQYFIQARLGELASTLKSYETILHYTGDFIVLLHAFPDVTEHFLKVAGFDKDLLEKCLTSPSGRDLLIRVLKTVMAQLSADLTKIELVEKFASVATEVFVTIGEVDISPAEEKGFIIGVVRVVEDLVLTNEKNQKEIREIMFHKAILALMMQVCENAKYTGDAEIFMEFLGLVKCVVKGNKLFYESAENKRQIYGFVLDHFGKLLSQKGEPEVIKGVLRILADIGFETEGDETAKASLIVSEVAAIETYYKILVTCFKLFPDLSNAHLGSYILSPLKAASGSLYNSCVLSRVSFLSSPIPSPQVKIQHFLVTLLKYAGPAELLSELATHISALNNVNTTSEHLQKLMRHFIKTPKGLWHKSVEEYRFILLRVLTDSVAQEGVQNVYHFNGSDKSFISLKAPLVLPQKGICWTGWIRLEKCSCPRQYIFSLSNVDDPRPQGVDLFVENGKLIYFIRCSPEGKRFVFPGGDLVSDQWYHITICHLLKELTVWVNQSVPWNAEISADLLPREYHSLTVGGFYDVGTEETTGQFCGEMSAQYWFVPSGMFKETIKDVALRGEYLAGIYDVDETAGVRYLNREFAATLIGVLDPKTNLFGKSVSTQEIQLRIQGRPANLVGSLNEVQIYFNRPGKDIFYNLGGFKTVLPLLGENLTFLSSQADHEYSCLIRLFANHNSTMVINGMLRLLAALCKNKESEAINFLIEERGIEILKHLLEKVGKSGKLNAESVEILFQILEIQKQPGARGFSVVTSALIERVVFNLRIWGSSDYSVQKSLLEKAHGVIMGGQNLPFSAGEPYRVILRMLYDYYAPEEVEDPGLRKFLQGIRWQLTCVFIGYFQKYGDERVVPTLVEFLLPKMDSLYSIRDLLYIIMLQQQKKPSTPTPFSTYLKGIFKNQRKEYDLIVALHAILNNSISFKATLSASPEKAASKSTIDCCEHVVSYCIHILLSFGWTELCTDQHTAQKIINYFMSVSGNYSRTSSSQEGMTISSINQALGRSEGFLALLNPGSEKCRFSRPEEIVLHFLFHRLLQQPVAEGKNAETENYERGFIGEKTYLALISHLLPEPSLFYTQEKEVQSRVADMKESEFNVPKIKLIYATLLANTRAFELPVQRKFMLDTGKFLTNRAFMYHFLRIDPVFESICGYLSRAKYLKEPIIKDNLEKFYIMFVKSYWKQRKDQSQAIFRELSGFPRDEFLHIVNLILDEILLEPLSYSTDEGIYASIQFVYFLEDTAGKRPELLIDCKFIEILGKTVLYMGEINMLYFWFPSYTPSHLPRDISSEPETSLQREGGVVRALVKLLLSVILKSTHNEADQQLSLKLLNFFIFRKRKTFKKLAEDLNAKALLTMLESGSPKKMTGGNLADSFLDFSLKGTVIQNKLKLVGHDKGVTHQKTVEEICKNVGAKKDPFESAHFRAIFLITQISQVLIYEMFGIDSYKGLPKDESQKMEEKPAPYQVAYLIRMIGKILKSSYSREGSEGMKKMITEMYKECIHFPDYGIENCVSPLDGCTKGVIDLLRPASDYSPVSPVKTPGKSTSPKDLPATPAITPEKAAQISRFQDETMKCFTPICEYYCQFLTRKITREEYLKMALGILSKGPFVRVIQPGLHKVVTEDLLVIEKAVLALNETKPKAQRRLAHPKIQPKENKDRLLKMHRLVEECNKIVEARRDMTRTDDDLINEVDYERLKKMVLSEHHFVIRNVRNRRIYQMVEKYYRKFISRCPLYRQQLTVRNDLDPRIGFQGFVKLDLARDNLNRAIRLKEMKSPLQNPAVLKGLSYVRRFFLKRVLIRRLGVSQMVLVPTAEEEELLKALTERATSLKRVSEVLAIDAEALLKVPSCSDLTCPSPAKKPCATRVYVSSASAPQKPLFTEYSFTCEIIKVDYSIFGTLTLSETLVSFQSRVKDSANPLYRLGSESLASSHDVFVQYTKRWKLSAVTRVMVRHYNMVRQSVEILFGSHKSILLVFFSPAGLEDFLVALRKGLHRKEIVEDPLREFQERRLTEDWRKHKMGNFEYLMQLNDYSSRTFDLLSQYPVFPWVLRNYAEKSFKFDLSEFRDLTYPIAGITPKKRAEAAKKYEHTDDFPGGRFQYGSHYLPGLAVLGYLMRLQPYTVMNYRFNAGGGDCPSRMFHFVEVMWKNLNEQTDSNLELVPEFFYNPEFLINL